jgi:hypothetical protein
MILKEIWSNRGGRISTEVNRASKEVEEKRSGVERVRYQWRGAQRKARLRVGANLEIVPRWSVLQFRESKEGARTNTYKMHLCVPLLVVLRMRKWFTITRMNGRYREGTLNLRDNQRAVWTAEARPQI